ncbi:MAG: DUF3990 domain-containing protein [Lachnospiraceae bacterium]|nr:DUF3990 domain-containing protein [Lachnospiraceae bacterium]
MILYHGSNMEVRTPHILNGLRALDFGPGFYLTSSLSQAGKWAKAVVRRRRSGRSIVNIYEFKMRVDHSLRILEFSNADKDWLQFVVRNRREKELSPDYDLVIGPVANDTTLPVIDDYMDGKYDQDEAVKRLMPQNLTDQYAFLTEKALSFLSFERSEEF